MRSESTTCSATNPRITAGYRPGCRAATAAKRSTGQSRLGEVAPGCSTAYAPRGRSRAAASSCSAGVSGHSSARDAPGGMDGVERRLEPVAERIIADDRVAARDVGFFGLVLRSAALYVVPSSPPDSSLRDRYRHAS